MKSTMMLPAFLLGLTLTASAGASPTGIEQTGILPVAMTPSPTFAQVDANKDGVISNEEVSAAKALQNTSFDSADLNRDGSLSKAEYDAATKTLIPQEGG
jgi:hypothetical protein